MEGSKDQSWCHELDELDREIALLLQENARIPFTKIAEKLGVTERTIRLRVTQMQEEGILSLVGVVNPIKVGLNVQTYIQVAVAPQQMDEVVKQLREMEEIRWIIFTTGDYDLMLEVLTRDYDDLSEFLMKKLNHIDGVSQTNVITVLKKLKSRFNFVR
ncbi:Lrp/AsnC family transcriptional regulator for asnA, asnC and gidA [Melghirimyces profundicolus]|uniref:Lrp/AsnC family transcriptional regulator for asnA, asnC and gidA n=1 Tax=Melghirimyces profundicolus TaxID=1242148 RepID=A0A2T6C8R5_9BACL|nr:Lrp/AsnC family transcriptional regulator [Melghirimyces profundicolus]PTX64700.1 Lrp/AsnC family transcriptional regulator for asnA, asnC and gidA [Melghirimyces profundicolus]